MNKAVKSMAVSILFVGLAASVSLAQSIGYIDVQQVFNSYEKTKAAQADVKEKELALQQEIEKKQKEIEAAKKKNTNEESIQKMIEKYEKELEPKRKELMEIREKLTTEIQADIVKSTKAAAKEVGLDVVLDKQVFITGGIDITNLVIKKLSSSKK
ncbi:MAG: hypothetical protein DKM50_03670 [Candidatus Margulisiibacteriota bacterium]|nr:MAG: hypothetical protein A2X43_07955 [Candidatus Margulisbacteria bacterium GWD2_39_127]OGI03660.1 MAG: hypothetical protein A2X42_06435 [Candidatus Margulisbacteria bacterium GWF2_38_17]OGI05652.1 MAG: hypothetical protein A2X41_03485 [Candidatus Margulisbacteria bacterium GWE2_39_32]PZM82235.1 MAG: hypothetical protein DKM50_03670 [Candidatus Margulisiibacteriota bacterium]HAR63723.1 hypothetical protein [Candidatus Margulisiibacteriota bacterium]